MSGQPHPQLLHGRNLSTPSDQQKILDRQTVSRTPGAPYLDVPSSVQESIKTHYLWKEEKRKRDAREARLEQQAQISKLQKQRQEGAGRPVSPIPHTSPSNPIAVGYGPTPSAPAPAPSPSQGTAMAWSPSPDRTKRTRISTPIRPSPPAFPSSLPEEPLEVQLPKAHTEEPPTTSQADTPYLRRDTRSIETPPCGQPSQPAVGTPAPGEKRVNQFKPQVFNWPVMEATPQNGEVGRPPMEYTLSKRVPPYRSSLPSSSNRTSIVPPPGQTVPHDQWPAPYQHSPLKGSATTTPSAESEKIVASAGLQLSLSSSQMPLAQTMSYVSPDLASQPSAQQQFHSSTGSAQEVPFNGAPMQSQASQPIAVQSQGPMDGVRSEVLSRVRNGRSSDEQEEAERPNEQQEAQPASLDFHEEPSAAKLPDAADSDTEALREDRQTASSAAAKAKSSPRLEESLNADSAHGQANEAEAAGDSQEASTMSAASAISATQQPVKLSISFDDSASPFDTFCKVYKEYSGDLEAFVKACMYLEHMWKVKTLHSSLWDDFVGHFPLFQARFMKGRRDQLYASEWYNDRDEEAVFTKKLINKTNLAGILSYHNSMVQKFKKRIHHGPKKQPQEPPKQQLGSAAKGNQTAPSDRKPPRDHKAPSSSHVVIIDSQSDHDDATYIRKSPGEPPATSTETVSENRETYDKTAKSHAKRSSASTHDIVASTPGVNGSPAPAEPISEHQRIAQEALLLDGLSANRMPTPAAPQHRQSEAAPSSSKPSSTLSRTKGPMSAAQRKAVMSFYKPNKGKGKSNKEGTKDTERRTSSLTISDAS